MATVEIKGIDELTAKLRQVATDNPEMKKQLQGAVRKILSAARKELSQGARGGLEMNADPRSAYKAVRSAVYRRIFGGQVNILQSKRASAGTLYLPPRKGLGRVGGNRWGRSERTNQVDSYTGKDRGFILRFLNAGANDREARSYFSKRDNAKHTLSRNASRGSITPRNWFGAASVEAVEKHAADLDELIQRILTEEFL